MTAGTRVVEVTPYSSIMSKASSKLEVSHSTAVPPLKSAPRIPGFASPRSCEAGSTHIYTVSLSKPHLSAHTSAL